MSFEAATIPCGNGDGRNGRGLASGTVYVPADRAGSPAAGLSAPKLPVSEWLWIGVILLAAGVAHAVNMFHFPYYESDEGTYASQAWAIVHQGQLSPYTYFYDHSPAGWIQLAAWAKLTGGFHTFGPAINGGRVLMLLMRMGVVLMLYRIVVALGGGRVAGSLACLLFAFSPYGIYFGRRVILDNIASFWTVASLYLLTVGTLTLRRAALAGLLLGVAALSKEPMVALFPAFAGIAWARCRGERRVIVATACLAVAACTCSLYVLMAALHGELFPAGTWLGGDRPHVSLIGSLQWQASRGKDGGVLQAGSKFWVMVPRWVQAAGLLVIVGTAAAVGLALRVRRAPMEGAIGLGALSLWAFLGRGGIVIYFYLVPLLPLLALCVALGIARLSNWLQSVQWRASPGGRAAPLAPLAAALACLFIQGREFTHGALELGQHPVALWRDRQADSLVRATDWLLQNAAPNSRVVIDQSMWNDLHDPLDSRRAGFTCLHYYWKVMYDPAVREAVQDDWRTIDYLVVTPQLLSDSYEDPAGGPLREAIARSTPVAAFDTAKWPVEVRRVDAPPAAVVSADAAARRLERGRVSVARGTVVSDRGTLLRGATFELDAPDAPVSVPALGEGHWREVRSLGLNTIRFDVKLGGARPRPVALERQLPKLDRAVDLAGRNGMYIVIMSSAAAGAYDKDELLRFWSVVAARYRDRTHVLYEMVNEPVAWYPRHYTAERLRDLRDVYRVMRRAAPETHIVLWTFANLDPGPETARVLDQARDVFYTRELVGFHWYDATAADAAFLQREYPLFMTETSPGPPKTDDLAALQACEKLEISWVHLEGKARDTSRLHQIINRLHETGFTWSPDAGPPDLANPPHAPAVGRGTRE